MGRVWRKQVDPGDDRGTGLLPLSSGDARLQGSDTGAAAAPSAGWRLRHGQLGRFRTCIGSLSSLPRVDHPPLAKEPNHLSNLVQFKGEAAMAPANLALGSDEPWIHVRSAVSYDGAMESHAIIGIEADEPLRTPVLADIGFGREVGAARSGVRIGLVRELLQQSGVLRIRTASVRNQVAAFDLPACKVNQMETWLS